MDDHKSPVILVYTITLLVISAIIFGLLIFLKWPLMAELPLGVALSIELFALAYSLIHSFSLEEKKYIQRAYDEVVSFLLSTHNKKSETEKFEEINS